jgi:hypothetical protein
LSERTIHYQGASLDVQVLLGFAMALTILGAWRFSKIEV